MPTFIHVLVTLAQAEQNQVEDITLKVHVKESPEPGTAMAEYLTAIIGTTATIANAENLVFNEVNQTGYIRHPVPHVGGIYVFPDTVGLDENPDLLITELQRLFPEDWAEPPTTH